MKYPLYSAELKCLAMPSLEYTDAVTPNSFKGTFLHIHRFTGYDKLSSTIALYKGRTKVTKV